MIVKFATNVYCLYSTGDHLMCGWQVRSPRDVIGVDSDDEEEDDDEDDDESGNEMDMFEMVSVCNCLKHVMTR